VAWGLTVAGVVGVAGSGGMDDIRDALWAAAEAGDVGEVERLVGQDPGLLNAGDEDGWTPLMHASAGGHVGVVRCLLDKGAGIDAIEGDGFTALWIACCHDQCPV
jgi:hypothetical protein